MTPNSSQNYQQQITAFAKKLGFDLIGFTKAKIAPHHLKSFKTWLKNGNEADMKYMHRISPRCDLQKILPGAKSVIVLGVNYYRAQAPLKPGHGRIARYAYGRDYHKIIGKKLKKLEEFIKKIPAKSSSGHIPKPLYNSPHSGERHNLQTISQIQTKSYIDAGPILERALAEQASLGHIGKNTCLITKEFGSWVFLAEIITTLDLIVPVVPRTETSHFDKSSDTSIAHSQELDIKNNKILSTRSFPLCGTCTRCIDACPTGAIIAPGVIDARRCISYLTIENKKAFLRMNQKTIRESRNLFGCDICQEVCPHNQTRQKPIQANISHQKPKTTKTPRLRNPIHKSLTIPKIAGDQLNLKKLTAIKTDQQFLKTFAGSPLMRAKREGLRRNAK